MKIDTSRTEWAALCSLIDRAVAIIKSHEPTTREYNVARQLRNVKNKMVKRHSDKNTTLSEII